LGKVWEGFETGVEALTKDWGEGQLRRQEGGREEGGDLMKAA